MGGSLVKTVTMRVLADAGDAQSRLDAIDAKGKEINRLDVRLRVRADDADAKAKLDADMAAVEALGAKDVRIRVTIDDRGVKEKLGADKAAADAAGKSLGDSAGGAGGALGPIVMWGSLGGIIAAVAPALVSAGMGTAAFAALAYPAVTKVKGAYDALSQAQQKYQQAAAKEAADPTKANQKAEQAALLNLKLAHQQISKMPASEQDALKGVQGLVSEFGKLSTAFEPQAFSVFAGGLKIVTGLLQSAAPLASAAAKAFTGVEQSVSKAMGLGQGGVAESVMKKLNPFEKSTLTPPPALTGFQQFIKQMTAMVGPAISAISGLAGALLGVLGHALTALAPMSVPFIHMLSGIVSGLGPTVTSVLKVLVTALSGIGQVIQPLLGPLGQLAGIFATTFGQVVGKAAPVLAQLAGAIGKVASSLSPLIPAAGQLVIALLPVVSAVARLVSALSPLTGAIASAAGQIATAFAQAMTKAGPSLSQLAGAIGQVAAAVVPMIPAIAQAAISLMPLIPAAAKVVAAIAQMIAAIAPAIAKFATLGASIIGVAAQFDQFAARMVSAVVGGVAGVISAISGLPGKILGIFASAETWLFNAGKSIIQGLINGIESMVGSAISTVEHIGSSIISGISGFLGIHSPSKKMHVIGEQTWQGYVLGLQGGQSEVSAAAALIADSVVKPFTSGTITSTIRKLESIAPSKLADFLKSDNAKLQSLANQRAILEKEIQQSEQVAQQAIQQASIMNAPGAATPADSTPLSPDQVIAGMKAQADQARQFAQQIQQLQKMGLNATSLSQLIGAGASSGLPVTQALTSGGKQAVSQINDLEKQIHDSAAKLGDAGGSAMYQAGVDAAKGLAAGLKSQLGAVDSAIQQLAQQIIASMKKALKSHSPSLVMAEIGMTIPQGVAVGIDTAAHLAIGASSRLAASTVQPWSRGGYGSAAAGGDIHVHFNGLTGDPTAAARQVVQVLKQYKRQGGNALLGIA